MTEDESNQIRTLFTPLQPNTSLGLSPKDKEGLANFQQNIKAEIFPILEKYGVNTAVFR